MQKLLTTVFLQMAAMESVSQSSTLVLMDKIYLVAYASIVLTLAQVIFDNRAVQDPTEEQLEAVAKRDRVSLSVQSVVTIGVLLALILPRLM